MSINPLDQFKVYPIMELPRLFGYDINFTNSSLYMIISVVLTGAFFLIDTRKKSLCVATETIYDFVISIIENNTGSKGLNHIPLIFTVFTFVLVCNLIGILPYCFTVTSQIIVTFALSMVIFTYTIVIGFKEKGIKFLCILLPQGTPLWLAPMMVLIELCAYIARPVSLSIRLTANMIAGHTIIKVIAGFIVNMNILLTPIPFLLIIILIGFEVFVAILQAYIFTSLSCVYLADSLK